MEIYSYTYGTCQTEQDFVTDVNTFLTTTMGTWELFETISDTSSNRDYAWKSEGEDPDNYRDIYIRMRAESNNIYLYAYGLYESSTVNWQELYSSSYSYLPTDGYAFRYWMFGNKDFVCFTILNSDDGYTYTGYLGLIESSYTPNDDDLPILCKGHSSNSYTWHSNGHHYMHAPVASGEQQYFSYNWGSILNNDIGIRNTKLQFFPVVLRNSTASNNEVRGRPFGVYQVSGQRAPTVAPITSASGVFLCFRDGTTSYTDRTYAYGPVATDIDNFDMW